MKATTVKYILLFVAHTALWNYGNFSQYLLLVYLPAMILCLPIERGPVHTMVVAFVTGLLMDFLVTGQLGLTSLALVPVALLRRPVIRLVFGAELFARGEELSVHRQGWQKFVLCILLLTAVFLLVFLWADSAGTRPLWFNAVKFGVSLIAGTALGLFVAYRLLEESGERWK